MKTSALLMALLMTAALVSEPARAEGTNAVTYRDVNEIEASYTTNPGKFAKDATEYLKTLDVSKPAQAAIGFDLFDRVMSKPFPDDDLQASDWVIRKYQFIGQCFAIPKVATNNAQILRIAQFLGEVRSKRIPHYKFINDGKTPEDSRKGSAKAQLQAALRGADWLTTTILLRHLEVLTPRDNAFIKQVMEAAHLPPEYGVTYRDVHKP